MNKNLILLVNSLGETSAENKFYMGGVFAESLSLDYLAASLESQGFSSKILSGIVNKNELLSEIESSHPIAIGFSTYTYTYKRALALAKAAKNKAASLGYNINIIFGGYHVACLPNETIAEESVDFAIKGEGDITICALMDAIKHSKDFNQVNGIFFKKDNKIIQTPDAHRIKNLDSLPFPKRDLKFLKGETKRRNLGYPPLRQSANSATLTYARGCKYACSFCTSRSTWGNQVFWRNPKSVADEIELLYKKYNVNNFAFIDLTFNLDRQKVLDLCSEIIKKNLPVYWGCLARLDLLDGELLKKMAEAKCVKINLGIESPIDEVTNSMKDNYSPQKNKKIELLQKINDVGIIIRAFLIIGFPNEKKNFLDLYIEDIKSFPIDELRVTIATPFPGTSLWNDCVKNNFLPNPIPWEKFTTATPVIKHPYLSDEEILFYRNKLILSFFFSENYKKHITKKFKKFPHLRECWKEYFDYLTTLGVFNNYKKEINELTTIINTKQ